MSAQRWKLDGSLANLEGDWQCLLDLTKIDAGCHAINAASQLLDGLAVAGLVVPHLGCDLHAAEWCLRGASIIATVSDTSQQPIRFSALWNSLGGDRDGGMLGGVELIVSVGTSRLESWPELAVVSRVVAGEVLRLVDSEAATFQPVSRSSECSMGPAEGPGCLLFRLANAPLSYVEMVYPPDFEHLGFSPRAGTNVVAMRHRFFARTLEKGVVLRCRVRGCFLDRGRDETLAAACFRRFAAEEPYLGP